MCVRLRVRARACVCAVLHHEPCVGVCTQDAEEADDVVVRQRPEYLPCKRARARVCVCVCVYACVSVMRVCVRACMRARVHA